MNILKRRNFKYSTASATFTAVVILLVMLLNAAFTILGAKYSIYLDLTSAELWTLSDTAKEAMAAADGEITITFCHDKDYIESNSNMQYISNTAKEIAKEFDGRVHIRYINSKLDPQLLKPYKYTAETLIRETDVIVEKGNAKDRADTEKPGEFRKLSLDAFFVSDPGTGELWAYNGEEVFAAAMLAVTASEHPKAYFTTGHGEAIDNASIASFYNTITLAGFDTGFIDLVKEDIPSDCRLLIINAPKRDFAGYSIYDTDAVSEIKKIDEYLDSNNTLMVFRDSEAGPLKNLDEFLYEWGIVFEDATVLDLGNSLTQDGKALVATYTENTLGASLQKEISKQASPPKTIVKNTCPISVPDIYTAGIDADGKATDTYEYYGNNAYREVSVVLASSPEAVLVKNGETVDRAGDYNLMTITRELNTIDNDTYESYVMAAGTKYFTTADYLESNTYGNEDLLYYAFRVMGREKVPANIDFKVFATTEIEDITFAEGVWTTVLLAAIIPLCATVAGIVITTRRKYR